MKFFLKRPLALLFPFFCSLTAVGAYETQANFTLSPGDQPGGTKLTAIPANGRVYFFQMSANGQNWAYAPTVKLGTTGTALVYEVFPTAGQKHFYRLHYTQENNFTAGATGDIDGDDLSNSAELNAGTDPFNPDSDYDGMPDGWELIYNLNPLLATDAGEGSDSPTGDTLSNLQEYRLGTHPKKNDTDGDGLNDYEESTGGTNPTKFDLPELYLEYAWREAEAIDQRAYGAITTRTVTGFISNTGTSGAGTPWSMATPTTSNAINASLALDTMLGTQSGSTEVPYSAWTPWPGGAVARFRQTFRGDAVQPGNPLPIISHSFHRRDVKVRLRASRIMPVAWTIHLTQVRQSYTGKPGREWELENVNANPVVLSLPKDEIASPSYTILLSTPSDLANPGPPTSNNPVNEFLVEYSLLSNGTSVVPVTSGPMKDVDGDAITDAVEQLIGTSTTSYSTNNNGVGDSDAKVSGIREPYLTLLSRSRSLYYSGSATTGSTTFSSDYTPFTATPQTDIIPGWPSLNGKLNAKGFPTTPPSDVFGINSMIALSSRPTGTESAMGDSDVPPPAGSPPGCLHASLAHKRTWGLLSIAPPANTTFNLLKVTSRKIKPSGTPTFTTSSVPLTFTAGNKRSTNFIDLIPDFNSTNGELVTASLLYPEIKPDANMAGVLGDSIPSTVPGSTIKHFVTPKKSTDLNQDYVFLKASGMTTTQITPGHADQVLVWEVSPAANGQTVPGDPLRCRVRRDTTGKTEVKLKTKTGSTVLATTMVWVVWANALPPVEIPITASRDPAPDSGVTITGGYNFTFNVQPATLFLDTNRPDFGNVKVDLPGKDVNGKDLNGGAENAWDISRQIRGIYGGMDSYAATVSMADKLPSVYPTNPIEGNDDSNVEFETNNPQANGGNLTSRDEPVRAWRDALGPRSSDLPAIIWKLHFREFTRLQIGPKWYLVSDYKLWRFHATITYNNGMWNNLGSEVKPDNANW